MEEWNGVTQHHPKLIQVEAFVFLELRREACSWERGRVGIFSLLCWFFCPHLTAQGSDPPALECRGVGGRVSQGLTEAGDCTAMWAPHMFSAQL